MEDEKVLLNGYGLNIFSFFRILKIKRAIKNGEKTARNYCILADWYSMFDIFNIKQLYRKKLYYALKAIRADKKYALAYALAGDGYANLNIKHGMCEKYLIKAIELGGKHYYTPMFCLFGHYLETQQYTKAYQTGTDFLNSKSQTQEYWAMSLSIISAYYGYCKEYKNAFKKYLSLCIKTKSLPNFSSIFLIVISLFLIYCSIQSKKSKCTGSLILDSLVSLEDYEHQLLLSNKMIIRERKDNKKNNDVLAGLYILKANAYMLKENQEYKKAMDTLEKFKECKNKNDLYSYYYLRADYAYITHDYNNALVYVNEALLHYKDANILMLKGFICNELEKYKDSIDSLQNSLDFKDCEYKGIIYTYLSEGYYALGEHNEALKYINQALLFEQSAKNYYAKANVLEALGRINESKECFEKYNELSE